ncbi:hypothetical protein ONS95_011760 [Cadophora gregata]|uniref:uncharacterized protein n=1 Tax=Cadophora gregata TaxID=51156 RepID=UPI0026DBDFF8|nr:uncharacterized protein ONS95_011760 [Cadophora gregata]KAK0120357.1 hypothetical protein ONS95_011760 [Cadophora gregata]KAK0121386.1 hypothetical protein ONS96_011559 [Cadophora gregata f. sp. sojae]
MAKSDIKSRGDLEILKSTVATTLALLSQLQTPTLAEKSTQAEVNALDLAYDAASLIRAYSTKISLLIINEPFTASAITKVLRELISSPLAGLASAVELCDASTYTKAVNEELKYQVSRVMKEFETLVKAIPLDGKILSDDAKNGTGATKGKGSLAMTGTVWQACDAVIELRNLGITGLVIRKAEQYRATLRDALEELQEWGEEESDEEKDGQAESGDEDDAQAAVDDIFGSQRYIPSEDPMKIRPRLESSLKRLKLLSLMYQAVVKRRFKTIPKSPLPDPRTEEGKQANGNPNILSSIDQVLEVMKDIPDIVDELASAFYELDVKEIDKRMDQCFFSGFPTLQLLNKNWKGQEDEFTTWVQKFQVAIKKDVKAEQGSDSN